MDEFSFVQSYLSGGEYVLWQGKPGKVRLLDPFYLSTALFAIPWLAFCGYWEYMAIRSGGNFMVLWGVPFILVGLYMLVGRPLNAIRLRGRTCYVITNRKLLIRAGQHIQVFDGRGLPPMDIHLNRDGTGTILFVTEYYGRRGRQYFRRAFVPGRHGCCHAPGREGVFPVFC